MKVSSVCRDQWEKLLEQSGLLSLGYLNFLPSSDIWHRRNPLPCAGMCIKNTWAGVFPGSGR